MLLRLHFPNAADGESLVPSEWSVRSAKPTPFLFLGRYLQKTLNSLDKKCECTLLW